MIAWPDTRWYVLCELYRIKRMGRALLHDPRGRWDATWFMERFEEIAGFANIDTDLLLAKVVYTPEEGAAFRSFNESLEPRFFELIERENCDDGGADEVVQVGERASACLNLLLENGMPGQATRNITQDALPSVSNPADRFACFSALYDWIDYAEAMRCGAPPPLDVQAFETALTVGFVELPTEVGVCLADEKEAELFQLLVSYIKRETQPARVVPILAFLEKEFGFVALEHGRQLRNLIMANGIPRFEADAVYA